MAARAKILVLIIICCLFVNCAYADVTVPKDTTVIPEQAFYGDRSLTEVELQEGLVRIESQAFANTSLTSVLLPRSLEYFAENAFEGCPEDFEIRVYARSAAEELCNRYRLPHTTVPLGKIGISMPTTAFMRWVNDGHSLKGALEYAGYETDLEFANNEADTQQAQLNAMIDDGCNVLIIAPAVGDAFSQVLAKAASRNVSVICYDRLLTDSENVDYYVSFSNEAVGTLQANYILQALNVNGTSRSYTLEITAGDPRDTTGRKFYDGAMSVLQPYINSGRLVVKSGQTSFASVATPGWSTDNAQARAAEILENYYSDGTVLDAWLCVNDSTALGVTNALVSGYSGQSWPVITGQDCDLANVRNILAGTQSMSVFKDTGILVDRTVQMAIQILEGQEVEVNGTVDNNRRNIPAYLCNPIYVDINNYYEVLIDGWYYTEDQLQGGTPVPSTVKIGVSMPTDALMRWQQDGQNLKNALKAYGYEVGLEYASNSVPIQLAQVDAMIDNGCKVLIIAPIDSGSFTEVLAKAAANNVTVISYDRLLMGTENVDYYVQFSYKSVGTLQGSYIRDALGLEDPNTAGPFTLEITAGDPADYNGEMFYQGGMEILQPYITSGKLVVRSGETAFSDVATEYWSSSTAKDRAEDILSEYYADTDIDAWFCCNDMMASGVIGALLELNYSGSWPVITGLDCDIESVRYIRDGLQSMSVFWDTGILVNRAAALADQILRTGSAGSPDTTTDNLAKQVPTFQCIPVVADRTNYEELLISSGYYTYEDLE